MDSPADNSKRLSPELPPTKKPMMFPPSFNNPTELVTFIIGTGDDEKSFQVHKEAACNSSPVLKAAFESQFLEGQTQTYRLKDSTERAFRLFTQWTYSGQLRILQLQNTDVAENDALNENVALIELWVLADKFCIPILQNLALQTMVDIRNAKNQWVPEHMNYIYASTSAGSLLRRYKVEQFVKDAPVKFFEDQRSSLDSLPHEFLLNLVIYWSEGQSDEKYLVDGSEFMVEAESMD